MRRNICQRLQVIEASYESVDKRRARNRATLAAYVHVRRHHHYLLKRVKYDIIEITKKRNILRVQIRARQRRRRRRYVIEKGYCDRNIGVP